MPRETLEVQVRAGIEADLAALTDIYNHYVRETTVTFDTTVFTPEERRPWLTSHPEDGPHRLLVAQERTSGVILGYTASGPFRPKHAYSTSVEVSVYLAPTAVGRGIGTLLYKHLFEALADEDLHRAYAGIAQPNIPSTRLHERFGFRLLGTFREAGRKFGKYHDVAWYEKDMDEDMGTAGTGAGSATDPGSATTTGVATGAGLDTGSGTGSGTGTGIDQDPDGASSTA